MIRLSIRRKIIAIALILIILMTIAALLSMALVMQVSGRLEDLTQSYVPAYGALARAEIHSLERAVALRRMVIEKNKSPANDEKFAALRKSFETSGAAVDRETKAARALIDALIAKGSKFGDTSALVRLDTRLVDLVDDTRVHLNEEIERLLPLLGGADQKAVADSVDRVDALRDELDRQLDAVRTNMIELLQADSAATARKQQTVTLVAIVLTVLAAALGLLFSVIVSSGLTRPVRRLLEGARAVEAGNLDETLAVTSQDEIGHLTIAFNNMVEQLRSKERIRETFGRYVDPRIVEGLIERPATSGDRGPAARDDGAVLRHEGLHRRERRHDPAGPGQGDEPLFFDDVGADPPAWRHYRQVYRRRHHGLLGAPLHGRCRSGALRLRCRARHGWSAFLRFATRCRISSVSATCRSRSTSASASRPARRWSAASGPT